MALRVREVFDTFQGEGLNAGRRAVFVRFTGCNLWSGKAEGRATGRGACASWCDTDFVGGDWFEPEALASLVRSTSTSREQKPLVVLTGGEPTLQLSRPDGEQFVRLLLLYGFDVAVETNGTTPADVLSWPGVHVCVSPKGSRDQEGVEHVVVRSGAEIKIVAPQWSDADIETMSGWSFAGRFVQPLDRGDGNFDPSAAMDAAARHGWRIGVQLHKILRVP